jgi:hypothetical protein
MCDEAVFSYVYNIWPCPVVPDRLCQLVHFVPAVDAEERAKPFVGKYLKLVGSV